MLVARLVVSSLVTEKYYWSTLLLDNQNNIHTHHSHRSQHTHTHRHTFLTIVILFVTHIRGTPGCDDADTRDTDTDTISVLIH